MHRLLRNHLRRDLEISPERLCRIFEMAFKLLRRVVPMQSATSSPTNLDWQTHALYSRHILSLHMAYSESKGNTLAMLEQSILTFAELLSDVANYLWERSLPKDALKLLGTAGEICELVLGEQDTDPRRIQILYLQASIELNRGSIDRAEAIARKEKILKLRTLRNRDVFLNLAERKTNTHYLSAIALSTAYNNLACAYMHASDYEQASPIFAKSLQIKLKLKEAFNQPQLPGIAEVYKNQAFVALARGEFQEAIERASRALAMINEWTGGGPRTKVGQFFRYIHACMIFNAGHTEESLKLNIDILEKRKDVLTDAHDHTIDSNYAVGMMYWKLGELDQAQYV
jgi:tetratricopeptide (TPR) repeat protein